MFLLAFAFGVITSIFRRYLRKQQCWRPGPPQTTGAPLGFEKEDAHLAMTRSKRPVSPVLVSHSFSVSSIPSNPLRFDLICAYLCVLFQSTQSTLVLSDLSIHLPICFSVCVSVCLPIYSMYISIFLSIHRSIYLSVYSNHNQATVFYSIFLV